MGFTDLKLILCRRIDSWEMSYKKMLLNNNRNTKIDFWYSLTTIYI